MSNRQTKIALILFLLLILAFSARYLILSRANPISLKKDSLAYQIEKSLQISGSNYRPLEGKDYSVENTRFFDGNEYVAVTVEPISGSLNSESLVLKKTDGSYVVIYGPSNFFQGSDFDSLPSDIKNFLTNKP